MLINSNNLHFFLTESLLELKKKHLLEHLDGICGQTSEPTSKKLEKASTDPNDIIGIHKVNESI